MPLTLLYIDDTEADIELMRALLGQRGIQVDAATDGRQGIAAYDPGKHAAIAIDWNLPGMDGIEVAKILREHYPRCPIAFISGLFEKRHIAAAGQMGVDRCFEKKMTMEHIQRIGAFVREAAADTSKKAH